MMIQCSGAVLQNGRIGPFSLSHGYRISIVWRHVYPGWSDDLQAFLDAIRGKFFIPGLIVSSPFHIVNNWATQPSTKKVAALLASNSREEMARFSGSYDIAANLKFVDLSGTPRTLVALESVRKERSAICVVLAGLDPLGFATVREYLTTQLREHAILEVLLPTTNTTENFYQQPLVEVVPLSLPMAEGKAV